MTAEEKRLLLSLARKAIEEYLISGRRIDVPESEFLNERRGVFVTLTKDGRLRGCIGFPEPIHPLGQGVRDAAISAATQDPRFPPVVSTEVDDLKIEISVLTKPEPVDRLESIQPGRDGLIVEQGFRRGLLLPQVATEYGWDRETFLRHTCRKAGLPEDAYLHGARVSRFTAEVFGEEDE